MPDESYFASRCSKVKWPTLRGAYLDDDTVEQLRKYAFGVVFLDGDYNTRLNFDKKDSVERAVFFEHLHKVQGHSIFLLIWVGNYHNGAIFHCAWQFPQMWHWGWLNLERAAIQSYRKVADILDCQDPEVRKFLNDVDKHGI